ncbi:MAG: hypothetical protein ACRD01_09565 [Terriglobales bacterium]
MRRLQRPKVPTQPGTCRGCQQTATVGQEGFCRRCWGLMARADGAATAAALGECRRYLVGR